MRPLFPRLPQKIERHCLVTIVCFRLWIASKIRTERCAPMRFHVFWRRNLHSIELKDWNIYNIHSTHATWICETTECTRTFLLDPQGLHEAMRFACEWLDNFWIFESKIWSLPSVSMQCVSSLCGCHTDTWVLQQKFPTPPCTCGARLARALATARPAHFDFPLQILWNLLE